MGKLSDFGMPNTYREAIALGYKYVFSSWTMGYVSRKTKVASQPVYQAGGKRKGLFYVLGPSWKSSRYCYRHYLRPPENVNV